nr:tRNA (N(6)-L-threonylcarbamoyladenosine(37)-C(2))-methylthiotransferase MtaB [Bacilli bacterium]
MKFKIISLGCKVNSYECSAIQAEFLRHGFIESQDDEADIVLINTCSVTATADQKSRQHIRKMMKLYPHAITVVMGCYSQGNVEYIVKEINPQIVIGTSHRNEVISLIEEYLKNHTPIVKVDPNPRDFIKYEELGVTSYCDNVRAYLKIQDGCDNFCSYCLIPYRRGKMRSRAKEDVLLEAQHLIKQGYPEIVLTGIHVGGYGKDLKDVSFSDLVESLCRLKGIQGLRISSIEESEIDDKLIGLLKNEPALAHHMHIPIQSGSKTTLQRMARRYNPEQFLKTIDKIKEAIPDVALTSDVIVGFPGESEEEFQETIDFIKACGFNMLHVFPFSAREGTRAYDMKNQISPQIKQARVKTLIELSNKLWEEYTNRFIGEELEVLIEKIKDGYCIGHTSNYIELKFKQNNEKIGQKS